MNKYRVVLIGSAKVGKTSIVNRFLNGQYEENLKATICVNSYFHKMNIEGIDIELQIWDTAGQEQYKSVGPMYYRNAVAAIAVFDFTDRQSLNDLEGWIESYRRCSNSPLVIIAGNKIDQKNHQITFDEAKNWADAHEVEVLIRTSAKSGEGISELFDLCGNAIINNTKQEASINVITTTPVDNPDRSQEKNCC